MRDTREPKILKRGAYWLILVPRASAPDREPRWYGQVWGKYDDAPSSRWECGTQEVLERWAAKVLMGED